MSFPIISIVTVTYNASSVLEGTILSVLSQSYANIEYIIIDGGSTDETLDIIKKYEDRISYWVSEPDKGIYDAMNKGIELASGQWINFMNAGDRFYNNNVISLVLSKVNLENCDIICGKKLGGKSLPKKISKWFLYQNMGFCHQAIFAKPETLVGGYNLNYSIAADYDWVLKSFKSGYIFELIDEYIVCYEGGGVSAINKKKLQKEFYIILKQYNSLFCAMIRRLYWKILS